MEQQPRNFAKFWGSFVKALSFSDTEKDKTECRDSASSQPPSPVVQTAEEALEHDFPASTPIRLLIFRSANSKEKILFDSLYVNDEGQYLPHKDTKSKFLKETVLEFAFGTMPLSNPETFRFTKITKDDYAFALVFNLSAAATASSTTHSPRKPGTLYHDSSTDSSSSSGYSSLPLLDDHSSEYSSSSSLHPAHSLPTTPSHLLGGGGGGGARGHNGHPSRITIGVVILCCNNISPSLLEPLLLPLKSFVSKAYRSRGKFGSMLKSYHNCLSLDLQNSPSLSKQFIPPRVDILPLFSLKIFSEFVSYLVSNPSCKISVIASPKTNGSALAIFKICYLIKNFKAYFPPRDAEPESITTTSPSICTEGQEHESRGNEMDSGFFSCATNICDQSEDDKQPACDTTNSNSNDKTRNFFYLGDEEDEEQTEEKLALSEPNKDKLFPNKLPKKKILNIKEIPFPLDVREMEEGTKRRKEYHYHVNSSNRFSPFECYQLFSAPPSYDMIHSITNEILEINLEKLCLRVINVGSSPSGDCKEAVRSLVSRTKSLIKSITDEDKTLFYFLVHLMESVK